MTKVETPAAAVVKRPKTGGRKPGTPNRSKVDAAPVSAALSFPDKKGSPFPPYKLARVSDLVPADRNPRTHSEAQISILARLITEFGWTNPVLVDGKRGVIAGHGRVLAAKQLGLDVVPTIELSHLTAAQRRAYVIADNQSALAADWNDELLLGELSDLRDEGFDLGLTAFDATELDALFGDAADERGEPSGDKVHCPECGYEFPTVNKAFRKLAARRAA